MTLDDITIMTGGTSVVIGLVAGAAGGLAGIGGSIVMLPALALLFGFQTEDKAEQHLYMASAMCVNIVVSLFSSRQHRKAGAVDKRLVRVILPLMSLAIIGGVLLSNAFDGAVMKYGLVAFLFAYVTYTIFGVFQPKAIRHDFDNQTELSVRTRGVAGVIAAVTGTLAGFLGIGGGIVMVPALQILARIPLKQAIAASAAVMWVSSSIGAFLKVITLGDEGQDWRAALLLAACMATGAVVGAPLGAKLTHRLPVRWLRLVLAVILAGAGARMLMSA